MIFLKKNTCKFYKERIRNGEKYNPNKFRLEYYDDEPEKQNDEQPDE